MDEQDPAAKDAGLPGAPPGEAPGKTPGEQPAEPPGARRVVVAGLAVWVLLALASARTWEHQHDEGISFDIAIGALQPFSLDGRVGPGAEFPADPVPVTELYRQLDGDVGRGFGDVVAALREPNRMPHPPAFYLGLHAWTSLVGSGTVSARLPAILLGLATLLGVRRLARRLVPVPGAGEAALVLMALSPWFLALTSFLRPYSLALCASVWALESALALHAGGARRLRHALLFALCSWVGLLTVYHYGFVFAWQGVLLAVLALTGPAGTRGARLAEAAGLGVLVVGATAPWWPAFAEHLATTGDSAYYFTMADPFASWDVRLYMLAGRFCLGEAFAGPMDPAGRGPRILIWSGLVLVTLVLAVLAFLRPARGRLDRLGGWAWATSPLLPVGILAADLARGTGTFWVAKYGFGMFPLGILLATRAWMTLGAAWWRRAGLAAWVALLLLCDVDMLRDRTTQVTGMERVARVAAGHDEPGHVVVLSSFNRRFGTPQVLTLRDHDVGSVRVVRCRREQLPWLLNKLGADDAVTRLTLVQFAAANRVATPEDTVDVDMWPPGVVERLPALAAGAGWRTTDVDLQAGSETSNGAGKPLTLLHDVVSKTFHGRN